MLPWFTKYPNQNDEILNLDWVIRQVENLKAAYEAFLAANSLTFADPIVWDITKQYSKNTIVLSPEGDAYLSKKVVGAGIQLNNTEYWLEIFNFAEYVRTANSNLTMHIELNTTRATASYAVDDWLLWEDVLYKVTGAIEADDLLTVGTNIVHFTVEDFCRAWQTYMVNTIAQYKLDIDASELLYKQQLDETVLQYKNDIDASELAYKNQLDTSVAQTTASLQAQLNAAIAGATVDSEVINIRVGANGITYSTAGDAVRGQFSDLKCALDVYKYAFFMRGDNLIDPSKVKDGYYLSSDGIVAEQAPNLEQRYYVSDFLPVNKHNIISKTFISSNMLPTFAVYDSSMNFVRCVYNTNVYLYANGEEYVRICSRLNTADDPTNWFYATYDFYSPFSEFEDRASERFIDSRVHTLGDPYTLMGKNLFNKAAVLNGFFLDTQGEFVENQYYAVSDYIPCESSTEYTISGSRYAGTCVCFYDNQRVFMSSTQTIPLDTSVYTFTTPQGASYVRFSPNIVGNYLNTTQMEVGDSATLYHYYRDTSILKEISNVRIVGISPQAHFASIQEALDSVTDDSNDNPYIFVILPGTYDKFSMRKNVNRVRYISLIGIDKNRTFIVSRTGQYETPAAEIYTNGVIKNLSFVMACTAETQVTPSSLPYSYAVHLDFGTCVCEFDNCSFRSNSGPAIGMGLYKDCKNVFHNCEFYTTNDGTYGVTQPDLGAVFCHTATENNQTNQYAEFKNCIAINKYLTDGFRFRLIEGHTGNSATIFMHNSISYGASGAHAYVDEGLIAGYSFGNNCTNLNG